MPPDPKETQKGGIFLTAERRVFFEGVTHLEARTLWNKIVEHKTGNEKTQRRCQGSNGPPHDLYGR